ncbi:MAG: YafY family protein [bacterium]|nr:YafY family protein [bacterium]
MYRFSLQRIFTINRYLSSGRCVRLQELADDFGVSARTIQRDMAQLRYDFGAPLKFDRCAGGYRYTGKFDLNPPVDMTESEMLALYLAGEILGRFTGTSLEDAARCAFDKLSKLLVHELTDSAVPLGGHITIGAPLLRGDAARVGDLFCLLGDAIKDGRVVEIEYHAINTDSKSCRETEPLHLHYHKGAWYLIAFCRLRSDIRIFALDRIKSARLIEGGRLFNQPFDAALYLQGNFGIVSGGTVNEVALLFDADQARWVRERQWHPSQQLEERPDGSLVLHMRVRGLREVCHWVMSYGSHVRVIAPQELKEMVAAEVRAMALMQD